MVATMKVAALWDVTRVPTFQGFLSLMFGSGIYQNVSTPTRLHDVHVGRPQSSQKKKRKKKWLHFGSSVGCVCSDIVLDIYLPFVQVPFWVAFSHHVNKNRTTCCDKISVTVYIVGLQT
jgi:hypothetical protein